MTPTPLQIREARLSLNLTQSAAAKLLHVAMRTFNDWERGKASMPGAAWELLTIKVKEKTNGN